MSKQQKCYVYTIGDGFVESVALHSVNGSDPLHESYYVEPDPGSAVDVYMLPTWVIRVLEEYGYTYAWSVLNLDEPDEYPCVHLPDGYATMSFINQHGRCIERNAHMWD